VAPPPVFGDSSNPTTFNFKDEFPIVIVNIFIAEAAPYSVPQVSMAERLWLP